MYKPTPPKPPRRPSFGSEWQPAASRTPVARTLDRGSLAGLDPRQAAEALVSFLAQKKDYRKETVDQRRQELGRILAELAQRNLDLSSLTPQIVADYREYLRSLVEAGHIRESYAGELTKAWNSTMRAVFGEKGKPGEGLLMRPFRIHVREIRRLGEDDVEAMRQAIPSVAFRGERNRIAFRAYLELAWCTGARAGSLLKGNLRVCDVDWRQQLVRFRHMKNKPEHTAVMTERAAVELRKWIDELRTDSAWMGEETPVFVGKDGKPWTVCGMNDALKRVAAHAGLSKKVTTHVLRKSAGTLIGRTNPKYAALQLGVTDAIFNRHYNQPTVEDRMANRQILPGSGWRPKSAEEGVGQAFLAWQAGKITREEFEKQLQIAKRQMSNPSESSQDAAYV